MTIFFSPTHFRKKFIKKLWGYTDTRGLHHCIAMCFAHKCVAYVSSLARTVWALWNAGGRKTVFSQKTKSARIFEMGVSAWCKFYQASAVPRYVRGIKGCLLGLGSFPPERKMWKKSKFWGVFASPWIPGYAPGSQKYFFKLYTTRSVG